MLTNALSVKKIDKAVRERKPETLTDGEGLAMIITGQTSNRWRLAFTYAGKRLEMPLGSYPMVSLAEARDKRSEAREKLAKGIDPRTVTPAGETFQQALDAKIAHESGAWTSREHEREYRSSVMRHCQSLLGKPWREITQRDVIAALTPIWETRHETATRVLARIQATLDHARPDGDLWVNPCDTIDRRLPRVTPVVVSHPAMPAAMLPAFYAELTARDEMAARALELLLLSGTPRTEEVMQGTWSEIQGLNSPPECPRWVVPAPHLKDKRPRPVARAIPLLPAHLAVLERIKAGRTPAPDDLIFPAERVCASGGKTMDAMQTLLRDKMKRPYTVHGFRSTFTDWVAENHPDMYMAAERCLDHKIGGKVQQAYLRTDLFAQRAALLALWHTFMLSGSPASSGCTHPATP